MTRKIEQNYADPELLNSLYAEGYRFIVKGDERTTSSIDPWSGMPDTVNNLYAFDNKAEAEAYALTQYRVFWEDEHQEVRVIPPHTETHKEWVEREAREKAEKKARKDARDTEKAEAMHLTLDEYRVYKKKQSIIRKLPKEINECKAEIERLKAEIERKEKYLASLEKEVAEMENR